ncbi:AbaSI family restriction endonuclease [Salegentibacter sp. Hel_I_6]|uniref:AbaSI family restriction endonuclease n=1 Tax=Salegentibacter sp. Hel_I_6 TaxID=1250278 RepID=UPI00055C8152|nr:hypothetical protein [Salegentibacter sp. Hel_I_6]
MNNSDKFTYITKQLNRTKKKRFEHYVTSGIWHKLNDADIKFITQQYIKRPNGHALTDMYFPQFDLHVEVDESYHLNQKERDRLRKRDIINATNHRIEEIDCTNSLEEINNRIDSIVKLILELKANSKNFVPWSITEEQNPETYISRGFISINDNVVFTHQHLAANCFGYNYKRWQKGGVNHPYEVDKLIWFPKLYANGDWRNQISDDENTIIEKSLNPQKQKNHIKEELNNSRKIRIVFARGKDSLGHLLYRFKGEYELSVKDSNYEDGLVWKRISTEVKTYSNI